MDLRCHRPSWPGWTVLVPVHVLVGSSESHHRALPRHLRGTPSTPSLCIYSRSRLRGGGDTYTSRLPSERGSAPSKLLPVDSCVVRP